MADAAKGFITDGFPAPGLRKTQRLITGNGSDGKGHFLVTDHGDHHRVMGEQQAVAVIPYSTHENPVDLNDDVDVAFARENEVCARRNRCLDLVAATGSLRTPSSPACTSPPAASPASSISVPVSNHPSTAPCPSTTASF